MNPYSPPLGRPVDIPRVNRFSIGLQRSIFALIISSITCVLVVFVAKAIDSAIPGEGALNDATILAILRQGTLPFTLIVMISGFSTFAYNSGAKQINAGVCVIVVFLTGDIAAWALSSIGYQSPRRLRMEDPPLYLSEFLAYITPYCVSTAALTFIGHWRSLPYPRPNK